MRGRSAVSSDRSRSIGRNARGDRMLSNPTRLALAYYGVLIVVVTLILLIPASSYGRGATSLPVAAFTAVSSLTTCGISVVNMTDHWTLLGQAVILVTIQLGGLGVMTFASMLTIGISRRLSVSQRMRTATELGTTKLSEVKSIINVVLTVTFIVEALTFIVLFPALYSVNDGDVGRSAWEALFFAVSSYNNTGFTPDSAGLYVDNWAIGLPLIISSFIGTLGFPVILNIMRQTRRRRGPRWWSLHTKLTLVSTFAIIAVAVLWFLTVEWDNSDIHHGPSLSARIQTALTAAMLPRTTGFEITWIGDVSEATKGFMSMVMFIGSGSAGTAGGIHVTTFAVLVLVCVSVFRGRQSVTAFRRRIPAHTVYSALTITFTALAVVYVGALSLTLTTGRTFTDTLFEACSAFSLGGMTLGVTSPDNPATLLIMAVLMLIGRVGPMSVAYMIAERHSNEVVRWPQEDIVVG